MRTRLPFPLTVVALATLAGCGPTLLEVDPRLALQRLDRAAPAAAPASGPTLAPVHVETATLGGVLRHEHRAGRLEIVGELADLPRGQERARLDDARARAAAQHRAPCGAILLVRVDDALRARLRRHLAVRPAGAPPLDGLRVSAAASFRDARADYHVTVRLTATTPGDAPLIATGRATLTHAARRQLAWAVPVSVLLFPVGFAVAGAIVSAREMRLREEVFAAALDAAAAALARRLDYAPAPVVADRH